MRTTLTLLKLDPGGVLFWERSSLPSVNHHTRNQPFASSNTAIQQRYGEPSAGDAGNSKVVAPVCRPLVTGNASAL